MHVKHQYQNVNEERFTTILSHCFQVQQSSLTGRNKGEKIQKHYN